MLANFIMGFPGGKSAYQCPFSRGSSQPRDQTQLVHSLPAEPQGKQENKICHCFHFSPSFWHEVMGLDAMIWVFWMLSFKPAFSLSSFTVIKRLFHPSSFSVMRVVSAAYLRLLIFLLAILILAHDSSSSGFCIIYSAYKLNKFNRQYTALKYSFGTGLLFHVWF